VFDVHYEPVTFDGLPGWGEDDHLAAFRAFCASAPALKEPAALVDVARRALGEAGRVATSDDARAFFECWFRPHRVAHAGPGGLLT
ncbi:hypothetical protein ABTM34_20670, partial [Acinetobacter baumannii]